MEPNAMPIQQDPVQQVSPQPVSQPTSPEQAPSSATSTFPVKALYLITVFLFMFSVSGPFIQDSLPALRGLDYLAATAYVWFLAVLFAGSVVMIMFIKGLINREERKMILEALIALVVFALIGFGTCMVNMGALF